MKIWKILTVSLCAAFMCAGCGFSGSILKAALEKKAALEESSAAGAPEKEETAAEKTEVSEAAETVSANSETMTYGNEPNNLAQDSATLCFADGRVYYVNPNDELCSFALDGSDARTHGSTGDVPDTYDHARFLNYYRGKLYYMRTMEAEDGKYTRYTEIDCMDPETGTVEMVREFKKEGILTSRNGLLILGDELYYSCFEYDDGKGYIYAGVLNLRDGKENRFYDAHKSNGSTNCSFTTDGQYLYWKPNNTVYDLFRLPLAEVYDSEPGYEKVISGITNPVVFSKEGIYTYWRDPQSHDAVYCLYDYDEASGDWPQNVLWEENDNAGVSGTPESLTDNLMRTGTCYVLGNARAVSCGGILYYTPSADLTQGAEVADVSSREPYSCWYMGEFEDTLYLVHCSKEGDAELHTLTADGSYR